MIGNCVRRARKDDMYSEFFNLMVQPFSPSVDRQTFYRSSTATRSLAIMMHSLIDDDRLVVLTGAAGIGKTMLVRHLSAELSPQTRHEYLLAGDYSDTELLQSIAFAFDLDSISQSRVVLFNSIVREFRNISSRGEKILLIIDNAHALGSSALRTVDKLLDGQANGDYEMSVLLVGRIDLPKNLIKEFGSVRDQHFRMIASLQPLSVADTEGYIEFRLMQAGLEDQTIFSRDIISLVHTISAGVPLRINSLCDIAMLNAYARGSTRVERVHLENAMLKLGWAVKRSAAEQSGETGSASRSTNSGVSRVAVKDTSGNNVTHELESQTLRIGRAPDCDIRIDEAAISRYQADIIPEDGGYIIKSYGTTTPVLLNAKTVSSAALNDGDVVSIGNYIFHFELSDAKGEPSAKAS